jgi:transposase InsO family protein
VAQRSPYLSPHSRLVLCRRVVHHGWSITRAAAMAGVSRQTGSKWVARFRTEGIEGLSDRSRRPHRIKRIADRVLKRIVAARLKHRLGPHHLSWQLGIARSTIYAVLRRLGLNRLSRLEGPPPPVQRYEWPCPGDLVHLDTKRLGRIAGVGKRFAGPRHINRGIGWNYAHVAVDDHSRLAYAEELRDELGVTAAGFMQRAIAFFAAHGIEIRRVLTDNGSPYKSNAFGEVLADHGIAHKWTRPYRPQTNGKAEAFVRILINRWAYRRPYTSSSQRARALERFVETYNHRRPHGGLDGATPISRVRQ